MEKWNLGQWGKVHKEKWSAATKYQRSVLVGFLDPPVAAALLNAVYPGNQESRDAYCDFVYSGSSRHGQPLLELEVRLCRIAGNLSHPDGETYDHAFLPLAAIVSDALELISHVYNKWSQKSGNLDINCNDVILSPNFYLSRASSWSESGLSLDISKMQERLEPAMPSLEIRDLLECLILADRRPGPVLDLVQVYNVARKRYSMQLMDTWFDAAGFEEPNAESQKGLMDKANDLTLDTSNIDASFICSGAFRLMVTTRLEKHLLLDVNGYLQVYWDYE